MKKKTALITGITGQDGAYLAKFLIQKNYNVIGVSRNISVQNTRKLEFLNCKNKITLITADLSNKDKVEDLIKNHEPDEVYNLAAQSSVGRSFSEPLDTFQFNTISVVNLLDTIKDTNSEIKFYQASSSEMFGNVSFDKLPIKETHHFNPTSPYGISKASAHFLTINYREAFGLYTACGILFNHESCLRGDNFVIKKIINTALKIKNGQEDTLTLGNLTVSRDWGYAPKYVEAMWLMLQADQPEDYIICSGNHNTLQDFVVSVFDHLGLDLKKHLRLDQNFMRQLDLGYMFGDNKKAKKQLGWDYDMNTKQLISQLIKDETTFIKWIENHA